MEYSDDEQEMAVRQARKDKNRSRGGESKGTAGSAARDASSTGGGPLAPLGAGRRGGGARSGARGRGGRRSGGAWTSQSSESSSLPTQTLSVPLSVPMYSIPFVHPGGFHTAFQPQPPPPPGPPPASSIAEASRASLQSFPQSMHYLGGFPYPLGQVHPASPTPLFAPAPVAAVPRQSTPQSVHDLTYTYKPIEFRKP